MIRVPRPERELPDALKKRVPLHVFCGGAPECGMPLEGCGLCIPCGSCRCPKPAVPDGYELVPA